MDCREVPTMSVRETKLGYEIAKNGVVPYGDKRLRDSPDGEFHICTQNGEDGKPIICFFVPPPSY